MGINYDDITDDDDFAYDLKADSLDGTELIMALDEIFAIDIPDELAEKFHTVEIAYSSICNILLEKKLYLQSPVLNALSAYETIRKKPSSVVRQVSTILNSDLFADYMNRLDLKREAVSHQISNIIHSNWIEHVTTVPTIVDTGKLSGVHVIFLSKKFVYLSYFRKSNIEFILLRLDDFTLYSDYEYNEIGEMIQIRIKFFFDKNGFGKKLEFKFSNKAGVEGADNFLRKYYLFLEEATK